MKLKLDDLPAHIKKLNPHFFGDRTQGAVTQQAVCDEPLAEAAREESHSKRFRIRVTSFRSRLIDPDNLCPKYFIDCCRYAGLIPNDTSEDIVLEVAQQKSSSERTEITIEPE